MRFYRKENDMSKDELKNKIHGALGDPKAPWYGSDLVAWVGDYIEDAEKQKELLDRVCSQEPCPKCGYGVTGACYGCEIKRLKAENKADKKKQEERIETLNNRIYQLEEFLECEDCSAKTDLPQNLIGCKSKERIKQLEGEEPIPFSWWSECPKLAQKVMERIMKKKDELEAALQGMVPFIEDDFPNGTGKNHGTCATDKYQEACNVVIQALKRS